jgi:methyltransferase (TIGR00027 family)
MVYAPEPIDPHISRTALAMCAYCAFTRRHQQFAQVFSDHYSEELFRRAAVDGESILRRLNDWPAVEKFIRHDADGDLVILRHIVWRKRWISDRVRQALAQGMEQVVIVGSGLDTLAMRIQAELPAVPIFEVDQPDMLALKRRLVQEIAGPLPVRYVAIDLARDSMERRLLETDYDRTKPTLFVAEAVMEYLPLDDARAVFHFVRRHSPPGSRFLFTFFSSSAMDARSRGAQAAFAKVGEPVLFTLPPAGIGDFLREHGFRQLEILTPQYVREHYLAEIGMLCSDMTPNDVRDLLHITLAETIALT